MITIEEIINRKEDQTFECKSIQVEPKALAIPLVAMANADGGEIAIGVSDNNRRLEGIGQQTERLNELLRVPFDYCQPSIPVSFTYLPFTDDKGNANKVLVINVPASGLLHTNQADEAYMRVGDKSRKLNFDERMQLLYDKGERYYEDTPVYGATIDDIDKEAVMAYFAESKNRTVPQSIQFCEGIWRRDRPYS